ncbi:hypothetical protein ACLB1E_06815 [Escherichia coli]
MGDQRAGSGNRASVTGRGPRGVRRSISLAVISGPTFAKELAAGLPTAISLASTDQTFADDLQQLLHCGKSFRVYSNPDFIGVQLGGAAKKRSPLARGCPTVSVLARMRVRR